MYSKKESQGDHIEEYGEYVFSRTVKSVHRTYFLDVRATKGEDLFVSITESRKRQNSDGTPRYDRHKIVLYKEDILRFCEEFGIIEEFLKEQRPHYFEKIAEPMSVTMPQTPEESISSEANVGADVQFEDL
jgi:hypothetical protein